MVSRILAVDDSPTQAEELRILLEDAGFEVEVATDGLDALRRLRDSDRAAPSLIVTDLQMPRMDGVALVEAVRNDYPYIPTVLITSFGSEAIAARALRVGAASYVPKRNLAFDLVPTVREVLEVAANDELRMALRCMVSSRSRYILENEPEQVAPLVRHVEGQLARIGFGDPWDLIRVGTALREAIVNAMERGNLEIPPDLRRSEHPAYWKLALSRRGEPPYRDRRVTVDVRLSPSQVSFVVKDQGVGFDASSLPDPADPAGMASEGGRGLRLIRMFMDAVEHNTAGNEITMVKHRGAPARADAVSRD